MHDRQCDGIECEFDMNEKGNSKEMVLVNVRAWGHIGGILALLVTIKTQVEYDGLRRGE